MTARAYYDAKRATEAAVRVVHYVEHVVTGTPACGAQLGFTDVATSTATAVTCPQCLTVLGVVGVCTSCDLPRDHTDITHRPTGHAVWCIWTSCGHQIPRGATACTEEHPEERNTVSEPTETPPPAKKASSRTKKTTAPPAEVTAGTTQDLLTPGQQRRLEVLRSAARLLDDGETRGTAGELLALAAYIEGQDVDDDPAAVLSFTSPSTTNTEGAAQ